jgi:hypothetical protein
MLLIFIDGPLSKSIYLYWFQNKMSIGKNIRFMVKGWVQLKPFSRNCLVKQSKKVKYLKIKIKENESLKENKTG